MALKLKSLAHTAHLDICDRSKWKMQKAVDRWHQSPDLTANDKNEGKTNGI